MTSRAQRLQRGRLDPSPVVVLLATAEAIRPEAFDRSDKWATSPWLEMNGTRELDHCSQTPPPPSLYVLRTIAVGRAGSSLAKQPSTCLT